MIRSGRIDFQTKIILVLVMVLVPAFTIMIVVQNKIAQPILEQEMRQIGIATAEALELKIIANQWLSKPVFYPVLEAEMQEQVYHQPSIFRIEVFSKEPQTGIFRLVAGTVEYEAGANVTSAPPGNVTTSILRTEEGASYWEIDVPIRSQIGKPHLKPIGKIHLLVSTRTLHRVMDAMWRVTVMGAIISVIVLVFILSFFLRRAVLNERLLHRAETQNLQLSQKLHEAHREIMNMEKLAVMGQLTANFAHEIGTPLNAIGGHMQLLNEEILPAAPKRSSERFGIISGELKRIENIVKSFLQTTSKPGSQTQLVDINQLVEKALALVAPRLESLEVGLTLELERKLGPVRIVPIDFEQIFLNLFNNALDSLQTKKKRISSSVLQLSVKTAMVRKDGTEYAMILIRDTGMGIRAQDLKNVIKPFFTTKRPGEGTGLGLTICHQLVTKYQGAIEIDSEEDAWAEVRVLIPYSGNVV